MWEKSKIEEWKPELKPLSFKASSTPQDAFIHFKENMIGMEISCPIGNRLELQLRHFFPLICCKKGDLSKGFVHQAKDANHAFELIAQGLVSFDDISGCDPSRVKNIHLFLDIIQNPHIIAERPEGKLVYIKRYESPKATRALVAVVAKLPDPPRVVPLSLHPTYQ
jgi:hypothetical protein